MRSDPSITVIVCTRDPGERIARTVGSILASTRGDLALHVVDQSVRDDVRAILGEKLLDPRVSYLACSSTGLSRARNLGATSAATELLAFTDDDCVVTPTWLEEIAGAFGVDPGIGIVFGSVAAEPYDPSRGFLPSYVPRAPFLARSLRDKHRIEGIGASMAVRRSAWQALHGFDELLGAGAPFRSAEETDFVIRALRHGIFAYETTGATVRHAGFRDWAAGQQVIHDYLFGIAAALAKNLKCGDATVLGVAGHLAVRWLVSKPVVDLGRRSYRTTRLRGFLAGFRAGLTAPVNRATGHFCGALR